MRPELRDQRQRHIGSAVIEIAAARGLEAVSLRSVAREADTSTGQIQYQFTTVTDLLLFAFQQTIDLLEERVADDAAQHDPERLKRVALSLLSDDPEFLTAVRAFAQLRGAANHDERFAEVLSAWEVRRRQEFAEVLRRAKKHRLLHSMVEPEHEAAVLWTHMLAVAIDVAQGLRDRSAAREVLRYHFLRLARSKRVTRPR